MGNGVEDLGCKFGRRGDSSRGVRAARLQSAL